MKHKKLFISLTAIFSVIIFFAVFLMIWFFGDDYKDFEGFKKEFEIPGLADGAVPQGMTSCSANYYVDTDVEGADKELKTQQYFFISAYMTDGSPSRIYVVGEDTGYVGYVTMKTEDGNDFYGHCGGIALNNSRSVTTVNATQGYTLWVTGESMIYCAKSSELYANARKTITQEIVEKAEKNVDPANEEDCSIKFTASFNANCNASFCFYYNDPSTESTSSDRLFVGEFYRAGNYETDKKHWLTTPEGYQNTAFMYEYTVNSSTTNKYGLSLINTTDGLTEDALVPKIQRIYSIPEKIQGVALSGKKDYYTNNGILVLSESYGLNNSHLLCFDVGKVMSSYKSYKDITGESFVYEGVHKTFGSTTVSYTDTSLNVYYVDKNNEEMFLNDYSIPSMSEGMCLVTPLAGSSGAVNRVYVLFESAGKKYKTFVRQQLKNVYSFIPNGR